MRFTLAAAALILATSSARAAGPSQVDKDAARKLLEQGDERMGAKDYKGALEAYRRADDIMGVPTTSIEVGQVELKLGHLAEAYRAFRKAADYPKKPGEPGPFTQARTEAGRLASKIKPRIPRLRIEVSGPGPDVDIEVLIDGEPVDAWGRSLHINPGVHDVTAEAQGFESKSHEVVLQEGDKQDVLLVLEPIGGDKPVAPPPASSPWWTVAAVSLPIGGAGLVAGAVTGALSLSDADAVKEQCIEDACPPAAQDQLDRSRTLAHVSTATFVVGGVGAALGITALVIAALSDDEEEPDVSVGPLWLRTRF